MTLLTLIAILLGFGVLLWAISMLPWIDANIKKVIYVIAVVFLVLWLLSAITGHSAVLNPRLW